MYLALTYAVAIVAVAIIVLATLGTFFSYQLGVLVRAVRQWYHNMRDSYKEGMED